MERQFVFLDTFNLYTIKSINTMRKNITSLIWSLIVLGLVLTANVSCEKDEEEKAPAFPPPSGTLIDVDGNVYQFVIIGNQKWMIENLRVTKYLNGDPIPVAVDSATWVTQTTGAYSIYGNDPANNTKYGLLYNWHVVNDARGIAPEGWRVPTNADWNALCDELGGVNEAGEKLKEWGHKHWLSPNYANNSSGFTALPGGVRFGSAAAAPNAGSQGHYRFVGAQSYYWEQAQATAANGWIRNLYYGNIRVTRASVVKSTGASIRLVSDL